MKIDWTMIYKKHKGQWVALADDEQTVLGVGKKITDARFQALKKGVNDPIMMRVPENLQAFVGAF
ncbi:hypothetical protein [Flavobacterium sp.]|uniref:hypothetical protein n=1 Tax=Flavobacterium sp. TaxID=239 RepID=UPI004034F01F